MSKIIIFMIRLYQSGISPLFPASCRFYPSCSQYCIDAVTKYGVIKGLYRGIGRLLRCHPFHPGGCDPA